MTFGEKVAALRKKKGLSQEELGSRLYLSKQAVQKWESGAGMPEVSVLLPLSRILSVSVDFLLDDTMDLGSATPLKGEAGKEASSPMVERRRLGYRELQERKRKPMVIILPIAGILLLVAIICLCIPNNLSASICGWLFFMLAIFAVALGLVPLLISLKRYSFQGHEIITYAGAEEHYLIIDGYVCDYLEAAFVATDRHLKAALDSHEIDMTITWSNNVSLKIDGQAVFPEKR